MAWLQADPSGNFHVSFRFGGAKFKRSLKTKSKQEADARVHRLGENIRLVESGRLEIPEGGDVPLFLLSDGKVSKKTETIKRKSLSELFDAYFKALPDGTLEETTLNLMRIHQRHLERHLGTRFDIQQLAQTTLQDYIGKRSKEKGIRGRKLSATTIRKEVVTLRSIWGWAVSAGYLTGMFPNHGLKYPKINEKPRFHTWAEIESIIAGRMLPQEQQLELWDCLFLSTQELNEMLEYARDNARQPFIYPMLFMAAHTGARRSELLRSKLIDIESDFITLREKKRVRGQLSTRRVPVSTKLKSVLNKWREHHPGGEFTFCISDGTDTKAITADASNHHFQCTFTGSHWSVVRGWHCLRHSFCSNCASQGIDQRIIDSWVGHTTESMQRRYRHLFPNKEKAALNTVFG